MKHFLLLTAFFGCFTTFASAELDYSYDEYLAKHGLKVEECADHSPAELFILIREREKVGFPGPGPASVATTVNAFYQKYLHALQPYNDKHAADLIRIRPALRDLFYLVTDDFDQATHSRSYITHERIDAYVEHLITHLAEPGLPGRAWDLDLSVDDVANYVRVRFILVHGDITGLIDPDAFRGQFAIKLRQVSKQFSDSNQTGVLYYYLVRFADNFRTPLDPLRSAPE